MTTVVRQMPGLRRVTLADLRARLRAGSGEAAWSPLALVSVSLAAAVLYVWNLGANGFANEYYSAAALAASKSWSALFFGSFDAANFITVDKPPVAIWAMGLSVRLFGLSSWSILLPEALAGVASVGLLFVAVRRSFGSVAATVAAIALAVTPAATLMFRFNNPDAMLTLLLVAAAYALLRSLERGSYRWVALAGACVGLAFLTKYLQAYLVLPGFALVYGFSANAKLRRRIGGLAVAAASVVVASGWWVAAVQLLPASMRPFIGGSTNGSPLDLIFGYDGLGRVFGAGAGGGFGGGAGFGGTAGFLRLFNSEFYGQIAWLIPPAVAALLLGLFLRRWAHPTDRGPAGYLLWGSWFIVTALVFSFMSGTIHSYYAVALAPAIAALVGAGAVDLWRLRAGRLWIGGLGAGLAAIGVAWWGWQLLGRTPTFAPEVGPVAAGLAALAAAALAVGSIPRVSRAAGRALPAAAALGLCAALLAPTAFSVATATRAVTGSDPHPGPSGTTGDIGPSGPGQGGPTAFAGAGFGAQAPSGAAGTPGSASTSSLAAYLAAHKGSATWIVAVSGASEAGSLELETGLPVMAMGGFTGSDPVPTLAQLKAYVASGQLRYVIVGGNGGRGGGTSASGISTWVASTCTAVTDAGVANGSLYDCSAAAS